MTESGRLRVAMLGAFPPQAQGVQEYCRNLAEALALRCDVHAIGFRRMYPAFLFPGVKDPMDLSKPPLHAPHLTVEHRLTWYNPAGWLARAAAAPCDVFHLQWWSLPLFPVSATFLGVMRARRIPVVTTVHNVLPHEGSRGFLAASRMLCRASRLVLVHSEENRRQLIEHYGIPPARVRNMPMGIAATSAECPPRAGACQALGLDPARRYLLSFGTIRPYKGVHDLIEAFATIAPSCPDTDLIIAGKPWEDWAPYDRRIEALGLSERIHCFLGYQPEERISAFYAAAALLALPYTHFDAQSAVGAQAMAHGVPMVVSRVGGLPEWVDGNDDWITAPSDPAALAERLAWFLSDADDNTRTFQAIAERVRARVSPEGIAETCEAIYREVLA